MIFLTSNESKDKEELLSEIQDVKSKLAATGKDAYQLAMERKFLRHELADLLYELKQKDDTHD